jgi:hypothetical protein
MPASKHQLAASAYHLKPSDVRNRKLDGLAYFFAPLLPESHIGPRQPWRHIHCGLTATSKANIVFTIE